MADLSLFTGQCCTFLTPKQLKSLRQACLVNDVVDKSCFRESINTCGISIEELFNTYPIYDSQKGLYKSWGEIEFSWEAGELTPNLLFSEEDNEWGVSTYRAINAYFQGDRVLYIEDDGYRVSLYEADEDIPAPALAFDYSKWTKICQIETTIPAGILSVAELLERYGLFDLELFDGEGEQNDFFYKEGDMFIAYGPCEDTLCLYITTGDLPATLENLEEYKKFNPNNPLWQKFYCVDTDRNKCLEYQRRKEPAEGYEVVEIGSQGHYVEAPRPYGFSPAAEDLDARSEASLEDPPKVLSPREIEVLAGTLPPECLP